MIAPSNLSKKPWLHQGQFASVSVLLVIVLIYVALILFHINQNRPYSLDDIFFYTLVIASPIAGGLLLLLRIVCGEHFNDLNHKPARWWLDVLFGIGLSISTMAVSIIFGQIFDQILPGAAHENLDRASFALLASDSWRLALFLGPCMMLGIAGFEELLRVLLLSRWWRIASGIAWRWLGILIAALLAGLAHLYQGPGGVMTSAIIGLILAIAYLRAGRVWPLIIAHYLHDSLQIMLFVYLLRSG